MKAVAYRSGARRLSAFTAVFCFAIFIASIAHTPFASTLNQEKNDKKRVVYQGIAVDFSIEQAQPGKKQAVRFQEGDDVVFRFKITDVATGTGLARAGPAAWMYLRPDSKTKEAPACAQRIKDFLSGSIFSQAELDLNSFYVLALNQDATITVVDPLFGFGGTKLLALVALKSPGEDWAMATDRTKLFVSMPDSDKVAVVETSSWNVVSNIDVGPRPSRVALQPDEQYLWVAYGADSKQAAGSGVTVVVSDKFAVAARIPTGRGHHQMAFTTDNRFALVTNEDDDTLSVIDIRKLAKIKDVKTGRKPVSIAYSALSRMAYITHADGSITAVDPNRQEVVARINADAGLGQIKFAPGGRLGFVVNPEKDVVYILDSTTNRIVQTAKVERGPDQIAFSNTLAYVRHRDSETVLMIPLDVVGTEGKPVPLTDFPGGQFPFGKVSRPSPADGILQAPGMGAVLVANPADKTIYFYKEGMAAPMGNFSNYSREPRAVLVLDRSLREVSPGVYETTVKLKNSGLYNVAFLLNTPRIVHCFEVAIDPNPEMAKRREGPTVSVEPLSNNRTMRAGEPFRFQIKLINLTTKEPKTGLTDVKVLAFLAPGIWQKRWMARSIGGGIYEIEFTPPQTGIYYVFLESPSTGLTFSNSRPFILEAKGAEG